MFNLLSLYGKLTNDLANLISLRSKVELEIDLPTLIFCLGSLVGSAKTHQFETSNFISFIAGRGKNRGNFRTNPEFQAHPLFADNPLWLAWSHLNNSTILCKHSKYVINFLSAKELYAINVVNLILIVIVTRQWSVTKIVFLSWCGYPICGYNLITTKIGFQLAQIVVSYCAVICQLWVIYSQFWLEVWCGYLLNLK